jgi:flagellar assembly factor FliW
MIYGGEGAAAFIRLQKAILDQSDNHSLFAWKMEHGIGAHGFLATSPALFEESYSLFEIKTQVSNRLTGCQIVV